MHSTADYLRRFDLDAISRFERDISTALVVVRGWKNSFAPINRIPLDILCLIPTHLSSQKDRFRATFVCRHWRRVFIQHAALWTQLFLGKNVDYVATLLERAKGSALDVVVNYRASLAAMTLLSPHAQRIRHLEFPSNRCADILTFSEFNSGPLPLLRTLAIRPSWDRNQHGQPNALATPLLPILSGATNLEEFALDLQLSSDRLVPLNCFVFPNLTTFRLNSATREFNASNFLDFLQSSPTLRTVEVEIDGHIIPGGVPRDMVVVFPNIETFSMLGKVVGWHVYHLAKLISCPHAKHTSLVQEVSDIDMTFGRVAFPDPASLETIARQYSTSPAEQVTLEIKDHQFAAYSLTFQSSDATVIRLGFNLSDSDAEEEELELALTEIDQEIFSQACSTIRGHPLLSHVRRLYIKDWATNLAASSVLPMADAVGELFRYLGSLGELTIDGCDLEIFLAPFIYLSEFGHFARVFPHVKKLTILEGQLANKRICMDAIVELAKSQYEQDKPLEHVVVGVRGNPAGMAERIREWVSTVDCYGL
jgi:hypothetical protein